MYPVFVFSQYRKHQSIDFLDTHNNTTISFRFTVSEMKRIYRGFKTECPTGLITEEYNTAFLEMLGYLSSEKDERDEIFHKLLSSKIQRSVYIPDYFESIKELFKPITNPEDFTCEQKIMINTK